MESFYKLIFLWFPIVEETIHLEFLPLRIYSVSVSFRSGPALPIPLLHSMPFSHHTGVIVSKSQRDLVEHFCLSL